MKKTFFILACFAFTLFAASCGGGSKCVKKEVTSETAEKYDLEDLKAQHDAREMQEQVEKDNR